MKKIGKRIWADVQNYWMAGVAIVIYTLLVHVAFRAFCPMVIVTGLPCPGCGITRSLCYLLTGQVAESIHMHPMGIVVACFFLYVAWNRYIIGRNPKKIMLLITVLAILLLITYLVRMYLYFPNRAPYVYKEGNVLSTIFPFYQEIIHELQEMW